MLCKENMDDLDFFLRYLMDEYMYNDYGLKERLYRAETKYGLSMDDIYVKMDEFNKSYSSVDGDNRICIMCDSYYISNSSGVYTFIKHCITMFNKMGYVVDFITDRPARKYVCNTVNNSNVNFHYIKNTDVMYRSDYFETETQYNEVSNLFAGYMKEYLINNKPKLILANSLSTTKCIYDISDILDSLNIKHVAYTHIGDLLDQNKKDMYDFTEADVVRYLDIMDKPNMTIGTQSDRFIPKINKILKNNKNIMYLPEPYYEPSDSINIDFEKDGIIIISGNYKRKNYKDMLYIVGKMNVPVTILCANYRNGYYDIENLIIENNIKTYNIIDNLYNDYVPMMISRHKMLLQLSEIEVFPYSVLEAAHKIPCVINGSSEWGECFLDECYKMNTSDIDGELNNLIDIYNNGKLNKLNLESYQKLCYNKWYDFIK